MSKLKWQTDDPRNTPDMYVVVYENGRKVVEAGNVIEWEHVKAWIKLPPLEVKP
jgi:hypothetical protein